MIFRIFFSSARMPSSLAMSLHKFRQFVFDLLALQAGQGAQLHRQDGFGLDFAEA